MIDVHTTYKIALVAILLAISAAAGYMKGYDHANEKYLAFKADVQAQYAILEADAAKARLESEQVTADVSRSWASALDWYRKHPRIVRVRTPASCGATDLRPVPTSTGLTPPTGAESALGTTVDTAVEQCEDLLNRAVMDAAQLTHLQEWVRKQSEIKP